MMYEDEEIGVMEVIDRVQCSMRGNDEIDRIVRGTLHQS
jgi:hypothetical protein